MHYVSLIAVCHAVQLLANKSAITIYSPDFFHFHIDGLERLVERYGRESRQFKDALTLLRTVMQHVSAFLFESHRLLQHGKLCQGFWQLFSFKSVIIDFFEMSVSVCLSHG